MKIVAVVVLYNPGKEVISNILSYAACVDKVYVIDNSEKTDETIKTDVASLPNAIYTSNGKNEGIAKRLNYACSCAIAEKAHWLLTMDQDSSFAQKDILNYISCLERLANKDQIAMTGIEFIRKEDKEMSCQYTEVASLITSGSMINLTLFDEIGNFDEALFIDQVDFEYCYRAILKGYKVIHFSNIFLKHSVGVLSVHRSFKNFKNTGRSLHSAVRLYYMIRNYFYIKSKYNKNFSGEIAATKKDLLIRIKNNLFYGKERIMVIQYLLRGIIDFKRKKMGKLL